MAVMIAAPIIWLKRWHHHADDGACLADVAALSGKSGVFGGGLCPQPPGRASCKKALFVLLFVGVFLSRLTFFGDTVSTIVNIGHLY